MSNDRNTETLKALKTELEALQDGCVNTCHVIENNPNEFSYETDDRHKINCYVKGLETAVQNSNIPIPTDNNFLTTQFLNEMKEKHVQLNELTAYISGVNTDLDAEINRLKTLCSIAQEAKSNPRAEDNVVKQEHVQKAKNRFRYIKNELHGLLESMFPHQHDKIREILGLLMSAGLEGSSKYITIEEENFEFLNILKDLNIVTCNPYNHSEVKLNF